MANDFTGNPIFLDDFSAAIDLCASLGFAPGTPIKLPTRSLKSARRMSMAPYLKSTTPVGLTLRSTI